MPINEKLILEIKADVANLKRGIAQSKKSVSGFQKQLQGVSSTLKVVFVAALGMAARSAVKMAKDFDKSLTMITSLVGVASEDVKKMGETARKMAIQTGRSANDAAEALFYITSAGLRGSEAMEVLEASLKASAVGLGETKTIADLATSALNAYGSETLSATEATDVMVTAVREGKLEASELAASMGRVLPVAAGMGVEFHEVGAAFASMSRTGTNAAEAATSLRGILVGLLKPTATGEKRLKDMNLSYEGLRKQLKEKGLLSLLNTLKERFEGNTQAQSDVFGNTRALVGVMDLLGKNIDGTRIIFDNLGNSVGATDKSFGDAKTASLEFDIEMAKLNDNLLTIGQTLLPLVNKGLKVFNFLIGGPNANDFRSDLEKQKDTLVKLEKRVKQVTEAYEHWLSKGKTADELKSYKEKLFKAVQAVKEQKDAIAELTKKEEENTQVKDDNTESQNNNNDSVETAANLLKDYETKLTSLINKQLILGKSFDFASAKIDLTQQSLIDLLDAGNGATDAFKKLNKELAEFKSSIATGDAVKMGIEADAEGDLDMDAEWIPDDKLKELLDKTKTWREELELINAESDARLAEQTDTFFADDLAKRQEAFAQYSMQLQAIGQMFAEGMGTMTDSLVDSFGLADTGVQALVKSMLKMLARFAAQQLIQSIITKMLSKVDIGVKQGVANASAITAATNMAAGMGPYGLIALPGLIGFATGMVNTAFAGVQAFAEGGIVTSPMMGLVGEAGNEAIIPLDRLGSIMGKQEGEFVLRGSDLILAMDRAEGFQSRITG